MRRGKYEPRDVVNDRLTVNEQKVFDAKYTPKNDGTWKTIHDIARETGLSTHTVLRHLATIQKWEGEELE